ncbi:MAG: tetratricopeptide repeat protein, partial [Desulfovibrionales bacterium]|nr:tetratricopeptide repeat protein [Desulfovibrionales bacterium]
MSISACFDAMFKSPCAARPLANASFALNHYFHGYSVDGYHWVNLGVHIASCFALWLLSFYVLKALSLKNTTKNFWISWAAALLWGLHPIQTQAVTYIVQRMTSMAALFYFLSCAFFLKARSDKEYFKLPLFLSIVFGLLSLGCKEIAATLPLNLFFMEVVLIRKGHLGWLKKEMPRILFFGGAFFVFCLHKLRVDIFSGYSRFDYGPYERVLTQFRVILHYISLVFYPNPHRFNLEYDFAVSRGVFSPPTTLVSILIVFSVAFYAWKKRREYPLIALAVGWYIISISLESSIIPLHLVYEHRNYVPSAFIFLAMAFYSFHFLKNIKRFALLMVSLFFLLCMATFARNSVWKTEISLWKDVYSKAPGNHKVVFNYGGALYRGGFLEEGIKKYREALRLEPLYYDARHDLGNALMDSGNYLE